jgi:hypothetical protein
MTNTHATPLTPTQQQVLEHAHANGDGTISWTGLNVNGGARQKIIGAMLRKKLITGVGRDHFIAAGGYEALGLPRKKLVTKRELDAVIASAEAADRPKIRTGTKQALVIDMLKRPEGATIDQLCEATGWLQHTARGMLAGALKMRLGLKITSTKEANQDRVYRVTA